MRVVRLYRHPVKGLSPEPLKSVSLVEGGCVPGDRLFALENGPSGFDPAAPMHLPKIKFLMLMRNGALAGLATRYDDAMKTLTIEARRQTRRARQARQSGGTRGDRELSHGVPGRGDTRARAPARGAGRASLHGFEIRLRVADQSGERPGHCPGGGETRRSAALSRQHPSRGHGAVGRDRTRRQDADVWRRKARDPEDDRPMRRDRRRTRHGRSATWT